MNKERKVMLSIVLGCLAIVTGLTAWIININDTYSLMTCDTYDGVNYELVSGSKCCPSNGFKNYDSSTGKCYGVYNESENTCPKGYTLNVPFVADFKCTASPRTATDDGGGTTTKYHVTFGSNGGTFSDGSTSKQVSYEDRFYFEKLPKVSKITDDCSEGYELEGWKKPNGKVLYKYVSSEENGQHLTAVWGACKGNSAGTTTFSVTFDANGGEFTDGTSKKTLSITDQISISDTKLKVTKKDTACSNGYNFEGWLDGTKLLTNYIDKEESGKTLKAKWGTCTGNTPTTSYTVELNANGGTIDGKSTLQLDKLTEFDPADYEATKAGLIFKGWSTSSSDTTCENILTRKVTLNENKTYYACYLTELTINVRYEKGKLYYNDKEQTGSKVKVNTANLTFNDFELKDLATGVNYSWSTSSSCTDTKRSGKIPNVENNMTIYACYTYHVDFETYSGQLIDYENNILSESDIKNLYIDDIKYIKSKKDGVTFAGWTKKENDCSNPILEEKVTSPSKYYACYKQGSEIENPNTGSFLLYVAYLVGILSLVYTGYYIYKVTKKQN